MIEAVADTSSLHRSARGSITGRIFLRGPVGEFPDAQWSDFPVVILAWWIDGLNDLVAGKERSFAGMFMDGPLAFVVHRGEGKTGRIAWGTRGEEVAVGIVDVEALRHSVVAAGKLVVAACHAQNRSSSDLENLERAISRHAV